MALKRHGGWKSCSVAERYVDDSVTNKNNNNKGNPIRWKSIDVSTLTSITLITGASSTTKTFNEFTTLLIINVPILQVILILSICPFYNSFIFILYLLNIY